MATEIGIIKTLIGTAVATGTNGAQRTLQAGDRIFQDEVITTGPAGAVEVEFSDGSVMTLGRNSQAVLDNETFSPQDIAQPTVDADVEALQQALLEGGDLTQIADATAASAGTSSESNEGVDIVQILHEAPEVTPDAGFETTGVNVVFEEGIEEDAIVDGRPTAGTTTVLLDEDDLGGKSSYEQYLEYSALEEAFKADTGLSASRAYTQGVGDEAEGDDLPPGSSTILSGNLATDFGNDGAGDITFNAATTQPSGLFSGGDEVEYWISEDGHSLVAYVLHDGGSQSNFKYDGPQQESSYAEVIFTAEITDIDSGAFSVAFYGPVDHAAPTSEQGSFEDNLFVNLGFTVSDFDGDTVEGILRLDIDDDVPVVVAGQATDVAYEFTVTNHDEVSSAGYHSSYGYYIKDAVTGEPTTGLIIWDDVHDTDTVPVTITGYTPEQIGFFIIPNGDNHNSGLTDNTEVTFSKVNGLWQAFDGATAINGSGSPVIFDSASFNKDSQDHVEDNNLTGNQNWEDLQIPHGDGDYNDVNINVDWTEVTITGDVVDTVSFGADGPGSIDFSIETDNIIINGPLTSNGSEISFEARDSDNDGHNDLIVGSTDDGDVLTIEGILDGDYDLSIFGPIDDNSSDATVDIQTDVTVTDGDGDLVSSVLNISLNIDANNVLNTQPIYEP